MYTRKGSHTAGNLVQLLFILFANSYLSERKKYQFFPYLIISPRIADISLFYKVCRLFSFLQPTAELGLHYAYLHSQSLYILL